MYHATPIVFVVVTDPVDSGFTQSIAHPGGNLTGFVNLEGSLVEKWLQLLKEIAPNVTRVGVMFNPKTAPYVDYYLRPLQAAAPIIGVQSFRQYNGPTLAPPTQDIKGRVSHPFP